METIKQLNLEKLKNVRLSEADRQDMALLSDVASAARFHLESINSIAIGSKGHVTDDMIEQMNIHGAAVQELSAISSKAAEIVSIVRTQCVIEGLSRLLNKEVLVAANPELFLREDEFDANRETSR